MDIKLKNKSINFNLIAFIGSIGVMMIPIVYIFFDSYLSTFIGINFLIIVFLALVIIFYKANQLCNLNFKENIITLCYSNIFIELKIICIGIVLLQLQSIYNYLQYGWQYELSIFFASIILCTILTYGALCDCYKLSKITEKEESQKYIKNKLFLFYIYRKIKIMLIKLKGFICKRLNNYDISKKKSVIQIAIIIIYTLCSCGMLNIYINRKVVRGINALADKSILMLFIINIFIAILVALYVISLEADTDNIRKITQNILNGNTYNEKNIKDIIVIKDVANNIKNIEEGLNTAIEEAVKSERMKGELITNVSHDLKTPLTSIINYIDFLDKENISEEEKKKYISVLKERSNRLKVLIEDLFEVSKASSGNMELNMENIDLTALIRQTLGEFEEKIEKSTLQFIKEIPEHKVIIYADGKKTFRVFQNIISNIFKYSMDNSRVYINVTEEAEFTSIVFKNISKYQLNLNEEEILERFKRGDSSRTTEGSGLGLAIAKSLVELQGGKFEIKIDGDLFKVNIILNKGKESV